MVDHAASGSTQVEHAFADSGDGRQVHYAAVGDPTRRVRWFSCTARRAAGGLSKATWRSRRWSERARLVSVDRLGFGRSTPGKVETSLRKQAESLVPLLRSLAGPGKPILVGHSYGGPVIAKIAMDHPELVGGLVMVAPSIDPGLEKLRWYNHVASWRFLNWSFAAGMAGLEPRDPAAQEGAARRSKTAGAGSPVR